MRENIFLAIINKFGGKCVAFIMQYQQYINLAKPNQLQEVFFKENVIWYKSTCKILTVTLPLYFDNIKNIYHLFFRLRKIYCAKSVRYI